MTMIDRRRIATAETIKDLIAMFDASGVEYTCRAAIMRVIEQEAVTRCARESALCIRPRFIINQVCDAIHARKYPRK